MINNLFGVSSDVVAGVGGLGKLVIDWINILLTNVINVF
ncbi:hypothetical protein SAMN06295981_0804 [Corynebacterium pollutisoli]|uniref:Uncharacterized protein n=1 Tax=Corynebacterium pollutisoli TaxID=1610489 RepID=A0A1X7IN67_9CORY|nr:hypothetical protein SAMN06295981_0804 [Corynebacterium pollutisoli]